jgi:hypothetical protein
MENNIPTAKELLENNHINEGFKIDDECTYDISEDSMIEFAAMHVEAALKAAAENAKVVMIESCSHHTPYWGVCGTCGSYSSEMIPTEELDKDSILNSYSLGNIK